MGRKPRIEYEGAVYHVIQRGNNKKYIFEKAEDKKFILQTISEVKDIMGTRLFGYVIMSNHYHLLLKTEGKPLNIVMHLINSRYGRYYNGKYGCTGHVFEGRYKGILVKDDKYLLSLLKYIHQNPLRANMTNKVEDYKWCSDRYYRNNKTDFVDIDFILNKF
jgi:REP element-mobilizing transposase RayT